jgi:RNA polymerase sigma factor (sigma-70 family)
MDWLAIPYRHIEKRLRVMLRRSGRSREDTDDLIQEALLRLHEYCKTTKVEDPESFLIRTARNLSIDWHRTSHKNLYAKKPIEDIGDAIALIDKAPLPDVIFSAQNRLLRIDETLSAISERTRDIYFAHRAGYSYSEIGEQMGISKSTIEKHIARAVLTLMDMKESEG